MNKELLDRLRQPFKPAEHKERKLPGNGKWFYVPWQFIRKRLNEVSPDWEARYSDPIKCDREIVIRCKLTIDGTTREGVGTAPEAEYNDSGKRKGIGSPCECAIADAFKNAAEQFGVAAYLDDQSYTIKLFQSQQDGRAYKFAYENDWIKNGAQGKPIKRH